MDGTILYPFAGVLVALALIFSAIGIRNSETFPSARMMPVVIAMFAVAVVGTAAFAIANAREEVEHREAELAEHAAEDEGEAPEAPAEPEAPPAAPEKPSAPKPPAEETIEVASPADGSLLFQPDALSASAGLITILYSNPSPVPHNVAIEDGGETVAESETFAESEGEAAAELGPGTYVFFCTVPGHREAGMEGELTVK